MAIYRGYDVEYDGSRRWTVKQNGVLVYTARSEHDAYEFVDASKREQSKDRSR